MLTVALVGADGAGKSAVAARLAAELPYPVRRMYLGVSATSATHPLPTTRLVRWLQVRTGRAVASGGPPPLRTAEPLGEPRQRPSISHTARAAVRTANRLAEEAYQEGVSRWHQSRGRIVIYDRYYPADFHAHDLSGRPDLPWDRRLHAAFLRRCFDEPDLLIVLDAEPETLLARKGEGTLAELAQRRGEYLAYAATVRNTELVRADQTLDQVVDQVIQAIGRTSVRTPDPSDPHRSTRCRSHQPRRQRP